MFFFADFLVCHEIKFPPPRASITLGKGFQRDWGQTDLQRATECALCRAQDWNSPWSVFWFLNHRDKGLTIVFSALLLRLTASSSCALLSSHLSVSHPPFTFSLSSSPLLYTPDAALTCQVPLHIQPEGLESHMAGWEHSTNKETYNICPLRTIIQNRFKLCFTLSQLVSPTFVSWLSYHHVTEEKVVLCGCSGSPQRVLNRRRFSVLGSV